MITKNILDFNSRKRKSGNIVIMLLLTLVPIMGFGALAVDYGVLILDKTHLQCACDAASLAAAQELKVSGNDTTDTAKATTIAIATAGQNGVTITSSDISFSNNNSYITVTANLTRGLFFARVLGIVNGKTAASATAGANGPPSNYSNGPYVVPIGIVMSDYDKYKFTGTDYTKYGHTFTMIRHNKQALGVNDLALFDLRQSNGKSPSKMEDQLIGADRPTVTLYNYPGHSYPDYSEGSCTNTSCQQSLNASGVAQGKFFASGLDTLIDEAAGAPWHDSTGNNGTDLTAYNNMVNGTTDYSNPRVINLIVTDTSDSQNGNSYMPVWAYVPVYVLGYTGNGKKSDLNVTFLFLPTQSNLDPNLETSSGGSKSISLLN